MKKLFSWRTSLALRVRETLPTLGILSRISFLDSASFRRASARRGKDVSFFAGAAGCAGGGVGVAWAGAEEAGVETGTGGEGVVR